MSKLPVPATPSILSLLSLLSLISLLTLFTACAGTRTPLTPVSAGALAARLANERCEKEFGKRPFAPDDFEALLEEGRWHWGTAEGGKVDGYEVEVSFDRAGRKEKVAVTVPEE